MLLLREDMMSTDARLSAFVDGHLRAARFSDPERNPLLARLETDVAVRDTAAEALAQYCYLPLTIAEILSRGVAKLYAWDPVKLELLRNLGEEMGTRTAGESHVAILLRCLKDELGLDFSKAEPPGAATTSFIERLRTLVSERTPYESAGALFALEDSAVPELKIVAHVMNRFAVAALGHPVVAQDFGTRVASDGTPWDLNHFLAAHIMEFEVGHRDNLAATLEPFIITAEQRALFEAGFTGVLTAMEEWWDAIAQA